MTSHRKRKRAAQREGLTAAELQLCELLHEVLAALRWNQVLGWGNQYLLSQHAQISAEERDRVMRAAAETVDRDSQTQEWEKRLRDIEQQLAGIDAALQRSSAQSPAGSPETEAGEPPAPPPDEPGAEAQHGG